MCMAASVSLLGAQASVAATPPPTAPPAAASDLAFRTTVPAAATAAGLRNQLNTWYERDGVIYVGLSSPTAAAQNALANRLDKPVKVFKEGPWTTAEKRTPATPGIKVIQEAPKSTATAKHAQVSKLSPLNLTPNGGPPYADILGTPWYGGDRIISYQTINGSPFWIECTTTGAYGSSYIMTGGHCAPTGTNWQQGYFDGTNVHTYGNVGNVATVQWGDNRTDSELVSGSTYSGFVYQSNQDGSVSARNIRGAATVAPGSSVCFDGSTTGWVCGATVGETNACAAVTEDGKTYTVCGLDIAQDPNAVIVEPGDSGGPVLANVTTDPTLGSVARIAGTISANNMNGHEGLFADVGYQVQIFGVSPALG